MLCDCFKSRRRLEAEILVLRHQLSVLQQRAARRLHLRWADARSERAVRCAASRWGLALGIGSPFTILLPLEDRLALECTAELRGMSTNALALAIVRTVVREQLIDAVLDAGEAVANDGIG
jgi:hypothetical protein